MLAFKQLRQGWGNLATYVQAWAAYLLGMRPLLSLVLAPVVVTLPFFFADCTESKIRLDGMALQLLGVVVVAIGLNDTRRAFNALPTVWQRLRSAWARHPLWPRDQVIAAQGFARAAGSANVRARVLPGPRASVDRRLELLELQCAQLFDEVGTLSNRIEIDTAELWRLISTEKSAREQAVVGLKEQLRCAIAEGIPLQLIGVLFFSAGIIAGTASPQIANWVFSAAMSCS
jgi:hypothetical protein